MNRISRTLDSIQEHYDVVVIGSGYGGGVAASRLARAGRKVCLLERGREILPGEYPDSIGKAKDEIQVDAPHARVGPKTAMFDFRTNKDMNVLVGCGLGGTSLINANVSLEVDPRVFQAAAWPAPENDKTWPEVLEPYYGLARTMLNARSYPDRYPKLNKLTALEKSARVMGQPFYRPPINVNFSDRINPFGVAQRACNNCGDCCSGCNVTAKNTTLMNYLPDAHNHGAEIFTQASVRYVKKDPKGWRVVMADLSTEKETVREVTGAILILSAGTLGSTEILLRSREQGLALSALLGNRFSGNGDAFAIGYNSYWDPQKDKDGNLTSPNLNGIGVGNNVIDKSQYPGPCITGVIDMRKNAADVGDGLVIEEGSIPGAIASILAPTLLFGMTQYGDFFQYGKDDGKARLMDAQSFAATMQGGGGSLSDFAYKGAIARTQTYLVMSQDDAGGKMVLQDDRLRINWPGIGTSPRIVRDNDLIRQASQAIQGQFLPNPMWTESLGNQVITVHPLGGCRMGRDATDGVVDVKCRVFANNGSEVHDGLYVMDGAVFPGAAGVNPLLAITAIAERACRLLTADRGWTIDYALNGQDPWPAAEGKAPAGQDVVALAPESEAYDRGSKLLGLRGEIEDFFADEKKKIIQEAKDFGYDTLLRLVRHEAEKWPEELSSGLSFRETMTGYFTQNFRDNLNPAAERISDEFEIAWAQGKAEKSRLAVHLLVEIDNIHRFLTDPDHAGKVSGTIECPQLSAQPLQAAGVFNLFRKSPDDVETWHMNYDMEAGGADAGSFHFYGRKTIRQMSKGDWFRDTTTLRVNIYRKQSASATLVGKGIIRLTVSDLLNQATTIKLQPTTNALVQKLPHFASSLLNAIYLEKFAAFFGTVMFRGYGGMLVDLANFTAQDDKVRRHRALKAPPPEVFNVPTADGFNLRLTRYRGGRKGPILLAPGFTVNASSFAADTVDQNLVEFLCNVSAEKPEENYDVWLFDYRGCPDAGNTRSFDIDDIALQDWPTAVDFVRKKSGAPDVQVLAHCVASMSLLMAKLKGLQGVRSAICSQLTLHPVNNWLNYLKADINIVRVLGDFLHKSKIDIRSSDSVEDKAVDALLWSVPLPEGEQCTSACCRRVYSVYGPSYTHRQLNNQTHMAIREWFGEIQTDSFAQLTHIMKLGYVVDKYGRNTYLPEVKKIDIPITFIVGDRNLQFLPETSLRTFEWLRANHPGTERFRRHVFRDYAHLDLFIGKNAATEVFPELLRLLHDLDQKAATDRFLPPHGA